MDKLDLIELKLQIGIWASIIISTIFITQSFFAFKNILATCFFLGMGTIWLVLSLIMWSQLNKIEDIKFLATLQAWASQSIKEKRITKRKR